MSFSQYFYLGTLCQRNFNLFYVSSSVSLFFNVTLNILPESLTFMTPFSFPFQSLRLSVPTRNLFVGLYSVGVRLSLDGPFWFDAVVTTQPPSLPSSLRKQEVQ